MKQLMENDKWQNQVKNDPLTPSRTYDAILSASCFRIASFISSSILYQLSYIKTVNNFTSNWQTFIDWGFCPGKNWAVKPIQNVKNSFIVPLFNSH